MASGAVTAINDVLNPMSDDRSVPLRGAPSTAAVAGHPIHPMLIPFPLAFLCSVLATDLAARQTQDPFWSRSSRLLLGAGIVSGLAAGVFGAIDYYTIGRARRTAVGKIHAVGNVVALGLAAANLAARGNRDEAPGGGTLALTGATFAMLGLTGWAGGELSYRHMVGVSGQMDQLDHHEKQL